jgi:hypothetical protein
MKKMQMSLGAPEGQPLVQTSDSTTKTEIPVEKMEVHSQMKLQNVFEKVNQIVLY